MAILQDLDGLVYNNDESKLGSESNVWIDFRKRIIKVRPYGYMTNEGVTFQALYSFLKLNVWKGSDDTPGYNFSKFPIEAITAEQFYIYDGWRFDDDSIKYFKDAGLMFYGIFIGDATDISFANSDKSINSTDTDLSIFNGVDKIRIAGSASNDGVYTISSVSANKIVVNEDITDEDAGEYVAIEYEENKTPQIKYFCVKTLSVGSGTTLYYQNSETGNAIDIAHTGNANDLIKYYDRLTGISSNYFKIYNRTRGESYNEANNVDMGYYPLQPKLYYYALPTITDDKITDDDATVSGWNMSYTELSDPETVTIDGTDYEYNIKVECDGHNITEIWEWMQWYWRTDPVRKTQEPVVEYIGNQLRAKSGYSIWFNNMANENATKLNVRGRTTANELFGYTESAKVDIMVTPPKDGCEVRIYEASTNDGELSNGTEYLGYENWNFDSDGYCTWSYDYVEDKNCVLQIFAKGYKEIIKPFVAGDTDQVLSYELIEDRTV